MSGSILGRRFAWLATALLFVACASAPEPTSTKRKKRKKKDRTALKKKKKKKTTQEERDEQPDKPFKSSAVVITDDTEDEDSSSAKKKKKSDDDEAEEAAAEKKRKQEEEEEAAAEKRRKKEEEAEAVAEKKRKQEEEAEAAAAEKRRKKEAAAEAAAEKRRKKEEEAEAAAEKKRKQEEESDEDSEEIASTSKRKKDVDAEEASFKRKNTDEDVEEIDMSGPPSDADVIEMESDDEPPAGGRRVAAIPVPGVDSEVEEVVEAETLPPGATPKAINDRPLTIAKDKLAVHGGLRVGVLTLPDLQGQPVSTTSQSFALGGTYGAGDKLEIGGDYTLGLSPGSVKGPLTLHAAYRSSSSAKLDVAFAAALAIDFYDTTDPVSMQTTSHTLASFQLGAWARYRLTRKVSVFTGLPAVPASAASVSKLSLALPPIGYQLAVGLNDGGAIALDVPVGVGYQATPKLYAFADLDLAHIRIKNTVNAFLFKDFIPFQLGGFYALGKLDIGAQFSDDLKQGFDYLRFDILARYSIK